MNTTKQIYTKDKSVKITFRCDKGLGDWLSGESALVSLTPSAFVRQIMYQQMYATKMMGGALKNLSDEALKSKTQKAISTETAVGNANN